MTGRDGLLVMDCGSTAAKSNAVIMMSSSPRCRISRRGWRKRGWVIRWFIWIGRMPIDSE